MRQIIAVYGSLKNGFYNHSRLGEDAVFKGQWHVRGHMVLIGKSYPELKLDETGPLHALELYEVSYETFVQLNNMEVQAGYRANGMSVGGVAPGTDEAIATMWIVDELDPHGTPIEEYSKLTAPEAYVGG